MMQVLDYALHRITKGVLPKVRTPLRRKIMTTALGKSNNNAQKEMLKQANKRNNADMPEDDTSDGECSLLAMCTHMPTVNLWC